MKIGRACLDLDLQQNAGGRVGEFDLAIYPEVMLGQAAIHPAEHVSDEKLVARTLCAALPPPRIAQSGCISVR